MAVRANGLNGRRRGRWSLAQRGHELHPYRLAKKVWNFVAVFVAPILSQLVLL